VNRTAGPHSLAAVTDRERYESLAKSSLNLVAKSGRRKFE